MKRIIQASIALCFTFVSMLSSAQSKTAAATKHYFVIANYNVKDRAMYNKYNEVASSFVINNKGKVIVYTETPTVLEGTPGALIAIAEFATLADAKSFYNSKEYNDAKKLRIAATEGWVILTEGDATAAFISDQPKAYQFINYTIKDRKGYEKYMKATTGLSQKYDAKFFIFNEKLTVLEGNPESVLGVAEFPSLAKAEAFYNSAEYTAARKLRIVSTAGWALRTVSLAQNSETAHTQTDAKNNEFIDGIAELMAYSTRTPILRTPDQYGMSYEDIFFPAIDGVTLEGWFIPAKNSNKLIICNHPMPANRYGYPGHLEPWKNFGGFEVNFLPEYKILHDAGYNIIAYDMRNHGRSGAGNGGIVGHGIVEYRDVIGSLRYARSRPDTKDMKIALYSRCLGANSTFVAMDKFPEEFKNITSMIALQPSPPRAFVKTAMDNAKIPNGYEMFDQALKKKTGYVLDDFRPMEKSQADHIPTLVAQVKADFSMPFHYVEEIYDNISAKDKKLFWIEGTDLRFQGYNYFGQNPKVMLEWFESHFK
jgi:uncharacterized protein (DUF1330 family)/pimeloyl-ACP methyl ester carboxylesterase